LGAKLLRPKQTPPRGRGPASVAARLVLTLDYDTAVGADGARAAPLARALAADLAAAAGVAAAQFVVRPRRRPVSLQFIFNFLIFKLMELIIFSSRPVLAPLRPEPCQRSSPGARRQVTALERGSVVATFHVLQARRRPRAPRPAWPPA
jgi:hypothetical protein